MIELDNPHVAAYANRRNLPEADARMLDGTVDMTSLDVHDLLVKYEEATGTRHHADWRGEQADQSEVE